MLSETSGDFEEGPEQPTIVSMASSISKVTSKLVVFMFVLMIGARPESGKMSNSCSVEPAYRFNSLASGVLYRIAHFVRNCVPPGSSRFSLHSCHSRLRCHKAPIQGTINSDQLFRARNWILAMHAVRSTTWRPRHSAKAAALERPELRQRGRKRKSAKCQQWGGPAEKAVGE